MKLCVSHKIKIGLHTYKVVFNPHLQADEEKAGSINYRTQIIELDPAFPQSQREVILWHEVIHGVSNNFRLAMSEECIDNLATGVVQFLQDNFDIEFDFNDIPVKDEK